MSMDGNNRTAVINGNWWSYYGIVSFTLDYEAQVLYWVFNYYYSLNIESSNADGTNRQQLTTYDWGYYYSHRRSPGLAMYKDMPYLSLRNREIHKFRTNGENVTTFINRSVLYSGYYYHLRVTNQPLGELQHM